jgi:hypothetical protein
VIPWYETLLLLALCFILSYLTWRWVEKPARRLPIRPSKSLIKWVVATQLVLLVIGVSLWRSNGFIERFSPEAITYAQGEMDGNPLGKTCHGRLSLTACSFGNDNKLFNLMVRGGSHADAIVPVFDMMANKYLLKGVQASSSVSPFLIGVRFSSLTDRQNRGREELDYSALNILEKQRIKDVFLVGSWNGYIKHGLISNNSNDSLVAFQEGMEKAVSLLVSKGKRVWIILQVPSMGIPVPRWLALHAADQSEVWINNPHPEYVNNLRPFFERLSEQYGVQLLDPFPYLCRADNKCLIAHEGKAVYVDGGHISASGSLLLTEMLRPAFETMKQDR